MFFLFFDQHEYLMLIFFFNRYQNFGIIKGNCQSFCFLTITMRESAKYFLKMFLDFWTYF